MTAAAKDASGSTDAFNSKAAARTGIGRSSGVPAAAKAASGSTYAFISQAAERIGDRH